MSATADRLIELAAAELGYTECQGHSHTGKNHTKYGRWYGMDGVAWCAIYLSWVFDRAGMPEYRGHYTPGWANWFAYAGRFFKNPQRGDLAFFDFPGDSKERIQHVGIVESFTATTVTCIEGNTSAGWSGSQDNGGGVYRRTRPRSYVVGYGRPEYALPSTSPTPDEEDEMAPARLIQIDGDPRVFAVERGGITAKHIPDPDTLAALISEGFVVPLDQLEKITWASAVWLDLADK